MQIIKFNQLNQFDFQKGSGIYAWYYNVSLGDADINQLIEAIESSSELNAKIAVNDFLARHIYQFFREANYTALISGKLMPTFVGELKQESQTSSSLTDSILADPQILWDIKNFLAELSINFSSPIYIGMAKDLEKRLIYHKNLIEKFKNEKIVNDNFENRDDNFAARVVSRKMLTKNLAVSIQYIDSHNQIQSTLENLMNRINYPVLGRN